MYTGFTFPKKLGGMLLLSCYLPNADEFAKVFLIINQILRV